MAKKRRFAVEIALLLVAVGGLELSSQTVSYMTYASPAGIFKKFITTATTYLARDGGKVGVGTSAPDSLLDVNGTAHLRGLAGAAGLSVGPAGTEVHGSVRVVGAGTTFSWNTTYTAASDGFVHVWAQSSGNGGGAGTQTWCEIFIDGTLADKSIATNGSGGSATAMCNMMIPVQKGSTYKLVRSGNGMGSNQLRWIPLGL